MIPCDVTTSRARYINGGNREEMITLEFRLQCELESRASRDDPAIPLPNSDPPCYLRTSSLLDASYESPFSSVFITCPRVATICLWPGPGSGQGSPAQQHNRFRLDMEEGQKSRSVTPRRDD
ncbi:hypothetical protein AVEN_16427-1 [Araneus ventricosus]|uniref:Uncharacterized protein n=1 Tax=Araneus ventricosus TaxID=182803 RepID=A0A4Y2HRU4_ARAVE|nr:hypothetical protein AVEN_16427-1 [Araneus ventricosus]